jgi:hypothetical protein
VAKGDLINCQCFEQWGEQSPECEGSFIATSNVTAKFCPACRLVSKKHLARKYSKERGGRYGYDVLPIVSCKCPKCERIYNRRIFWTGNGMPRVYCWDCERLMKNWGNCEAVTIDMQA